MRERLLKLAAWIECPTRRIVLHLPDAAPWRQEWCAIARALGAARAYLLKEAFQAFWSYRSPYWAGCFLDQWCTRTMCSKLEPMKKVAKMLRRRRPLLLNWFPAKGQLSSGVVECFNTKAN